MLDWLNMVVAVEKVVRGGEFACLPLGVLLDCSLKTDGDSCVIRVSGGEVWWRLEMKYVQLKRTVMSVCCDNPNRPLM